MTASPRNATPSCADPQDERQHGPRYARSSPRDCTAPSSKLGREIHGVQHIMPVTLVLRRPVVLDRRSTHSASAECLSVLVTSMLRALSRLTADAGASTPAFA